MLEYPKHVYLDGDVRLGSRLVRDAAEEADAASEGHASIPSVQPTQVAPDGSPRLEYPKLLYKGDDTRLVREAADEADAVLDGYGPVGTPAAPVEHAEPAEPPVDDEPKKKKGAKA